MSAHSTGGPIIEIDSAVIIQAILDASAWPVPGPADQPEITLTKWNVFVLPNGDRHFVGWNKGDREGRVSTKITAFDPATGSGRTESGRVYVLEGRTGRNGDAMHTWGRWMEVNGAEDYRDVSAEFQGRIDAAQNKNPDSTQGIQQ